MAAKSNFKNMVICLTLCSLLCSAILGAVYAVTKEPIAQTNAKVLQASIGAVLPANVEIGEAQDVEVGGKPSQYYVATKNGAVAGYAVKSSADGFGGVLTVMVGVIPDGTIYNTAVVECNETPGLGAKCTEENGHFRKQWQNFDTKTHKLAVTKDNGDIDAITASTITSRAYTQAVANAVAALEDFIGVEVEAASGASLENTDNNEEGGQNE